MLKVVKPHAFSAAAEGLEAFETDPWSIDAILRVELLTPFVWDPCCGTGLMGRALRENGYTVVETDICDWSRYRPEAPQPDMVKDFLKFTEPFNIDPARGFTVFMNPPFSKAWDFIKQAQALGARKIVCFQRWAWRESKGRRWLWADNPPARIWLCGDRATCWRFDIPSECVMPAGVCAGAGKRRVARETKCRVCMAGTPTSHAWYVWERGHKPAEIISAIWKADD